MAVDDLPDPIVLQGKVINKLDNYPELTRESALEMISQNPWKFIELPIRFRNDKEIVLAAICQIDQPGHNRGQVGDLLQFASEELRNDREVVLRAVKGCLYGVTKALKYASEELRNDKEVVLEAIKFGGPVIQYASKRLRCNREIALVATQSRDGSALQFLAPNFRDDLTIVRIAINKNADLLGYTSPRLRSNREVVLEAVKRDGSALRYANPCFYEDKEVVLTALSAAWTEEDYGGPVFWRRDVIMACMSHRLREDPSVNKDAIQDTNGYYNYDLGPLLQKFQNLMAWRELRKLKREQEENWQKKYGAINKDYIEQWQLDLVRWQNDLVQWQQDQKKYQFEGYKALRIEIEHMPKYETWRQQVFARYGNRCEICGATQNLEIHHRESFYLILQKWNVDTVYKAFECDRLWDVDNGSILCSRCHARMDSSEKSKELSSNR